MLNQLKAKQETTIQKIKQSGLYFNNKEEAYSNDGVNKITNFMLEQNYGVVIYPQPSTQTMFYVEYRYLKPQHDAELGDYYIQEVEHFLLSVALDGKVFFYDQEQKAIHPEKAAQILQFLNLQIDFLSQCAMRFHYNNKRDDFDESKEESASPTLTT